MELDDPVLSRRAVVLDAPCPPLEELLSNGSIVVHSRRHLVLQVGHTP